MKTRIFVSGKIKSTYKGLDLQPLPNESGDDVPLNTWNAHFKTFERRKCWLVTHAASRYTVFIPDIRANMLKDFKHIFLDCLVNQLLNTLYQDDLRVTDPDKIARFIGDIDFFPTNNDKGCMGTLNQRGHEFDACRFVNGLSFEEFSFQEMGAISNWYATMKVNGKQQRINPVIELTTIINNKIP